MAQSERREILLQLKSRLVEALASAPAREVAAVSRELRATLAELDSLPTADGSIAPADEIAARYEKRRREAAGG